MDLFLSLFWIYFWIYSVFFHYTGYSVYRCIFPKYKTIQSYSAVYLDKMQWYSAWDCFNNSNVITTLLFCYIALLGGVPFYQQIPKHYREDQRSIDIRRSLPSQSLNRPEAKSGKAPGSAPAPGSSATLNNPLSGVNSSPAFFSGFLCICSITWLTDMEGPCGF